VATLNDISFKINSGYRVGIVGKTGSGKTTLINLISGLLSPSKGKIKINYSKEFNPAKTKLNIGYVSQSVYLSDDSIINNIALSDKISKKNIDFINKILEMLDLIGFTKKYERLSLGERGARISGGQIQRIGVARALYRSPSLLVLDEATSALDEKTENKIIKYLLNEFKKKIIIFCTHKKKLLNYCNKIIEVKNNKIKILIKKNRI
jgi:ABC-type bacteriocin/lantibiotic exporter with double-glycine peptidase domain